MNYRLLGNSGLRVAEMSLGTMTFGEDCSSPNVETHFWVSPPRTKSTSAATGALLVYSGGNGRKLYVPSQCQRPEFGS